MLEPRLKCLLAFALLLCVASTSTGQETAGDSSSRFQGKQSAVRQVDGLVAFWDFQEPAGQPRRSESFDLIEQSGPIQRVDDGVFGPFSARLDRGQYFKIARNEIGTLDIHGPSAAVTVIAWIKRESNQPWQSIAGVWDETRAKRQYCLFLNANKAMPDGKSNRTPVSDRIHGHVSAVGGPTPSYPFCVTYSTGGTSLKQDRWYCVAMRYDGQRSTVFVDGKLDHSEFNNPLSYDRGLFDGGKDGGDFTVGAVHRSGEWGNFFAGRIAGLAVYNRACEDQEIANIATMTLPKRDN